MAFRFCEQCGAQVEEGSKFCENCGASITPETTTPVQQRQETPVTVTPSPSPTTMPRKSPAIPLPFIVGGIVVILIIAAVIILPGILSDQESGKEIRNTVVTPSITTQMPDTRTSLDPIIGIWTRNAEYDNIEKYQFNIDKTLVFSVEYFSQHETAQGTWKKEGPNRYSYQLIGTLGGSIIIYDPTREVIYEVDSPNRVYNRVI
ncbi:MAG: hypothetical protein A4E40_00005 [Methanoregulaceae archaeon PtaU1.Bin059]|nr:MAG: hypothetical protein A4E40_00005 [Methanoregulaceae archaeon PtaU1.Bin059]